MPPIDNDDARACLEQAYAQLTQEKGEGTAVARLAEILFQARIRDLEAGRRTPTKFRKKKLVELVQETYSINESGFEGTKSYLNVLNDRIADLDPYRTGDGRYIRVTSPKHRVGKNEVHYFLDVEEVTILNDDEPLPPPSGQRAELAGRELFRIYRDHVPPKERRLIDDKIREGSDVEISVGRARRGDKRQLVVIVAVGLLLSSLAAAARWYYVHRYLPGNSAGSSVDVHAAANAPVARIIEDRPRTRLTPAMYWVSQTVAANGGCDEHNNVLVSLQWDIRRSLGGGPSPPYVLLRNGLLFRDPVDAGNHLFYDRDVLPGRSYTYALGKRDPRGAEIAIGREQTAFTPRCGQSVAGVRPLVAIFPDPPSGTAPVSITFDATITDDQPVTHPIGWEFGDGSPLLMSIDRQVTHVFRYGGEFTVTATYNDASGNVGSDARTISVVGPPAPVPTGIQNPRWFWHGDTRADVSTIIPMMGEPVTIVMNATRLLDDADGRPVSYRWAFGDCVEGHAPFRGPNAKPDMDCFVGPITEPRITRSFSEAGQFPVIVEVSRDNGDVSVYSLGQLTIFPTDAWIRAQPNPEGSRAFWQRQREAANETP